MDTSLLYVDSLSVRVCFFSQKENFHSLLPGGKLALNDGKDSRFTHRGDFRFIHYSATPSDSKDTLKTLRIAHVAALKGSRYRVLDEDGWRLKREGAETVGRERSG